MFGATEADKENYRAKLPTHLSNLERLLGFFGQEYFCGASLCVADLNIYDAVDVAQRQIPFVLDEFPKLKAFHARVEARPNIARWIASEQRAKLFAFPPI
jgi:glutathione S-transferase